jgi:hypothetical protein
MPDVLGRAISEALGEVNAELEKRLLLVLDRADWRSDGQVAKADALAKKMATVLEIKQIFSDEGWTPPNLM